MDLSTETYLQGTTLDVLLYAMGMGLVCGLLIWIIFYSLNVDR